MSMDGPISSSDNRLEQPIALEDVVAALKLEDMHASLRDVPMWHPHHNRPHAAAPDSSFRALDSSAEQQQQLQTGRDTSATDVNPYVDLQQPQHAVQQRNSQEHGAGSQRVNHSVQLVAVQNTLQIMADATNGTIHDAIAMDTTDTAVAAPVPQLAEGVVSAELLVQEVLHHKGSAVETAIQLRSGCLQSCAATTADAVGGHSAGDVERGYHCFVDPGRSCAPEDAEVVTGAPDTLKPERQEGENRCVLNTIHRDQIPGHAGDSAAVHGPAMHGDHAFVEDDFEEREGCVKRARVSELQASGSDMQLVAQQPRRATAQGDVSMHDDLCGPAAAALPSPMHAAHDAVGDAAQWDMHAMHDECQGDDGGDDWGAEPSMMEAQDAPHSHIQNAHDGDGVTVQRVQAGQALVSEKAVGSRYLADAAVIFDTDEEDGPVNCEGLPGGDSDTHVTHASAAAAASVAAQLTTAAPRRPRLFRSKMGAVDHVDSEKLPEGSQISQKLPLATDPGDRRLSPQRHTAPNSMYNFVGCGAAAGPSGSIVEEQQAAARNQVRLAFCMTLM